jgi:hypothetical protein
LVSTDVISEVPQEVDVMYSVVQVVVPQSFPGAATTKALEATSVRRVALIAEIMLAKYEYFKVVV